MPWWFAVLFPSVALLDFVDVLLHPFGAVPPHLVGDMPVDIQREGCGSMA